MHRTLTTSVIVCGAIAVLAPQAGAAVLPVNSDIAAAVTADNPSLGTFVASTGALPYSSFTFSGTVTQEIWQESPAANPLGGLTFTYRLVTNTGTGFTALSRVNGFNFGGFTADATFMLANALDQAPTNFTRNTAGSIVGFEFESPVSFDPGESSALIVVRTNAPGYTTGLINIIDGGSATVMGYAPVPEPGTAALLGVAAGALLLRRRQRMGAA